jgi:hypothetical protein
MFYGFINPNKIGVRDRANASNLIKKDNLLDYSI